jgi:hypothetical protein
MVSRNKSIQSTVINSDLDIDQSGMESYNAMQIVVFHSP